MFSTSRSWSWSVQAFYWSAGWTRAILIFHYSSIKKNRLVRLVEWVAVTDHDFHDIMNNHMVSREKAMRTRWFIGIFTRVLYSHPLGLNSPFKSFLLVVVQESENWKLFLVVWALSKIKCDRNFDITRASVMSFYTVRKLHTYAYLFYVLCSCFLGVKLAW